MFHDERFPSSGARVLLAFLGMLAITFGVSLVTTRAQGEFPSFLCTGVIFATFCLLAIWGVFAPGNWFTGWLSSVAGVILLGVCWALAVELAHCHSPLGDLPIFFRRYGSGMLLLPCFLFAVQIPLFFLRFVGGLRLVSNSQRVGSTSPLAGQFTVRDLIGVTTSFALVLACWRSEVSIRGLGDDIAGYFMLSGGIGALIIPGCIYVWFSVTDRPIRALLTFLGSTAILAFITLFCYSLINYGITIDQGTECIATLCAAGAVGAIFVGLDVLSLCGYEFEHAMRRSSSVAADIEPTKYR